MNNRAFITITIFIFLFSGLISCAQESENDRPNIIFILADDLGAGDLGCTGHPYAKSPNLDRLAENGIRFERAYMAGAWCAPSRYGIMSGQFPARYFDGDRNLRASEPTVTSMLKNAGYKTAHIGKWHLTERNNKDVTPEDYGIDMHFTTASVNTKNTWTKEERNEEYWRANMTDAYVDKAINFMNNNNPEKSGQPFYMNLWVYPTHSYIDPSPEQLAVYEGLKVDYNDFSQYQQDFLKFVAKHGDIDKAMQAYCADVTAMDKALGKLFNFLEKSGLDKNTLIVFTSDNGPGPLTPQVISESVVERYKEKPTLLNSVGSADIYKERKISLHDGGIRVPFIVSWPEYAPQGKIDNTSVIHGTDWLPTVASICNLELPEGQFDGMDNKAAFLGEKTKRDNPIFWTQAGSLATLQGKWKSVLTKNGDLSLFDIEKDPAELNNLKENYPSEASKMEASMKQWFKNIHDDQ